MRSLFVRLLAATFALSTSVPAANHTWTGNGANSYWSTAANWENQQPPVANETAVSLIFPANANRRVSTNNIAGLQVASLAFDGAAYTLRGTGAGTNLTLLPGAFFGAVVVLGGTGHALAAPFSVQLTGTNLFNIGAGASLIASARFTGPGSLRKTGDGTLRLQSVVSHVYGGVTEVRQGILELAGGGVAVPGPLTIGETGAVAAASVRLLAGEQIANSAPVGVHTNGQFQLNSFTETIGPLTLFGGRVDTGGGTLAPSRLTGVKSGAASSGNAGQIDGYVQFAAPATNVIAVEGDPSGRLDLYATLRGGSGNALAAIAKQGPGFLYLEGSNSFNGPLRVQQGIVVVAHKFALGSTNQGTFVESNATLNLNQVTIAGERLNLSTGARLSGAKACTWAGPIDLEGPADIQVPSSNASDEFLTLSGLISGPGGWTKFGAGILQLAGSAPNSYTGASIVHSGTVRLGAPAGVAAIPGTLQVGPGTDFSTKRVLWLNSGQVASQGTLRAERYGVLELAGFTQPIARLILNNGGKLQGVAPGGLNLNGPLLSTNTPELSWMSAPLRLGPAATNVHVQGSSLIVDDLVTSAGSSRWEKTGPGSLACSGPATFPGPILVHQGSAFVTGAWASTAFEIWPAGTLSGTGQVARVTIRGGSVAPTPGIHPLRIQEMLVDSGGNMEFDFRPDNEWGRATIATPVVLGSQLNFVLNLGTNNPAPGSSFILVHNQSAHPISGTFLGLPEGCLVRGTTQRYFQLTYHGGDGNDLAITRIATPNAGTVNGLVRLADGSTKISATGVGFGVYIVEAATQLTNPSWSYLSAVQAEPDGTFSFVDPQSKLYPNRFYRFRLQ